jgi:hypothetical protein
MRKPRSDSGAPAPWRFPVARDDIAETGQHFELVADAAVRAAIARLVGLRDVSRLEANFDVTRHGSDRLRVVGRVSATVEQTCVVTLERLANEVEEDIDLVFAPPRLAKPNADAFDTSEHMSQKAWPNVSQGEPEPLIGGVVDLGTLATEFLVLGLDPYPRKPGAVFQPQQAIEPQKGPFSILAQMTKGRDGN